MFNFTPPPPKKMNIPIRYIYFQTNICLHKLIKTAKMDLQIFPTILPLTPPPQYKKML